MIPDLRRVADIATFARAHIASGDIDPAYPVIAAIQRKLGMDVEERLLATLQYCAWYNLASAVEVWLMSPELVWQTKLPTGVERRGLRGIPAMNRHLTDLYEQRWLNGSWQSWLTASGVTWEGVSHQVRGVWGNARWAAYKMCELLQQVHEWHLVAPDMGNRDSSGPVSGLIDLYGPLPTVEAQDDAALDLRARLGQAYSLWLPWSQLETVLCDFHSMLQGHYYVGHDIDQMLENVWSAPVQVRTLILEARAEALPHAYLGEQQGWQPSWTGVDRLRNNVYASSGVVLTR